MSRQDKLAPPAGLDSPSEAEQDLMLEVNLRLRLDEIAEVEAGRLRLKPPREPGDRELRDLARKIYDARRMRDRMLEETHFGEPAWDMLLALYHLPASGRMLTVSGLCQCSGVPPTTALRWQSALLEEGLIERGPHGSDRRMQFVRLTEHGRALLRGYLTRLFHCERTGPLQLHSEGALSRRKM